MMLLRNLDIILILRIHLLPINIIFLSFYLIQSIIIFFPTTIHMYNYDTDIFCEFL